MSDTSAKIKELGNNEDFKALRDQAMESIVAMNDDVDELPGTVYRGFYVDANDTTGVFRSESDVDRYLSLISDAVSVEEA